jgi:hypothetical protein
VTSPKVRQSLFKDGAADLSATQTIELAGIKLPATNTEATHASPLGVDTASTTDQTNPLEAVTNPQNDAFPLLDVASNGKRSQSPKGVEGTPGLPKRPKRK